MFRVLRTSRSVVTILDAGCGNGHFVGLLGANGFSSHGIDPSESGIALARQAHPEATSKCADLTEALTDHRDFDAVTCIEVLEHVYAPRKLLSTLFSVLRPGGRLVLTTPYHGDLKNLAIVAAGRFDRHFNPLWEEGHIKFFSRPTLAAVLGEIGFTQISIRGIGRVPYLWKSMMACAEKPDLRAIASRH